MTTRNLAEVRLCLEEKSLPGTGESLTAEQQMERYESLAIAILDSEHTDFAPGLLEEYLQNLLYIRELELNLIPNFNESETTELE